MLSSIKFRVFLAAALLLGVIGYRYLPDLPDLPKTTTTIYPASPEVLTVMREKSSLISSTSNVIHVQLYNPTRRRIKDVKIAVVFENGQTRVFSLLQESEALSQTYGLYALEDSTPLDAARIQRQPYEWNILSVILYSTEQS